MDVRLIFVGYLVGAIPFALLLTRQRGTDVRQVGSGNVGAANVLRATGPSRAVIVMLLDVSKGCAVVLFAKSLGGSDAVVAAVAAAAVVGHVFPMWLGFRGGKGVATACGVFLVLVPRETAVAAVVFALVVWVTRYVSLGSLVATVVLAVTVYLGDASQPVVVCATGVAALVLYRHRSNVARLHAGQERRLNQGA